MEVQSKSYLIPIFPSFELRKKRLFFLLLLILLFFISKSKNYNKNCFLEGLFSFQKSSSKLENWTISFELIYWHIQQQYLIFVIIFCFLWASWLLLPCVPFSVLIYVTYFLFQFTSKKKYYVLYIKKNLTLEFIFYC